MSKVLDDLFAQMSESMHLNRVVLGTMWQWIQKKEADKTPDDWEPYTTFVPPSTVLTVVGHNIQRASLSIVNNGPVSVALANKNFDPQEAINLNTAETVQGTFPFLVLISGQSVTIGSRGSLYAVSLSSTQSTQLSVVETVYSTPTGTFANPAVPIGHAALLEKGLPVDADHADRQKAFV